MNVDPRDLLGGYTAGILTDEEQRRLLEAALTDQEIFDELAEDEELRQLLAQPAVRRELIDALAEPPTVLDRIRAWFAPPPRWAMAGGLAAAVVAVVLIRVLPVADSGTAPIGTEPQDSRSPFVSKSYQPTSPGAAREWTASYAFELREPSRSVDESHVFRSGDRFRIRIETDFAAYVYLFSRSESEDRYTVLHPVTAAGHVPTPSQGAFSVPPDGEWLELDEIPTDELMVMVVATLPVPALSFGQPTVLGGRLEPVLAGMERRLAPPRSRRTTDGERVRLVLTSSQEDWALVLRLHLKH
ncbi:MAG: DUF4384 domain-containing protein, partial [bacterium]|nr:DUF4384 domain-containing protein [bacterium]